MRKRALVIGAGGFVGRHLWQHLLNQGWTVLGSDILDLPSTSNYVSADLAKPETLQQLFSGTKKPSHVFHLAGISFVPDGNRDPQKAFATNTVGTINLLDAMIARAPKARLIYVGTSDVYGTPQYLPIDEEHPLAPRNPYAISKSAADSFCDYAAKSLGLDVCRVRPFNHSGPGQRSSFALSSFARQIAEIEAGVVEPVLKVGNLNVLRDFSHVADVVAAYETIALGAESGEVYNVCSERSLPLRALLDGLISMSSAKVSVKIDKERYRPAEIEEIRGCSRKIREKLEWTPKQSIEQALEDLLGYWRREIEREKGYSASLISQSRLPLESSLP